MKLTKYLLMAFFALGLTVTGVAQDKKAEISGDSKAALQIWGAPEDFDWDQVINKVAETVKTKAGGTVAYEMSCNLFTAGTSSPPDLEAGTFPHGTTFMIRGYIYPAGTLTGQVPTELGFSSGINEDGTAEFPDLVIGQWNCWGPLLADADAAMSTQYFHLDYDGTVDDSFVSTGYETRAPSFVRSISGGSGAFKNRRGHQIQTTIGFNASGAPNFVMTFPIQQFIFKSDQN